MNTPPENPGAVTPTNTWRSSTLGRHFDAVYPLAFSPFIAGIGTALSATAAYIEYSRGQPDKVLMLAFLSVVQAGLTYDNGRELRNEWRLARQGQKPRLGITPGRGFYEVLGRIVAPSIALGLATIIVMAPDKRPATAPTPAAAAASAPRP